MNLQDLQLAYLQITGARYVLTGTPCFNTEHKIALSEIIC